MNDLQKLGGVSAFINAAAYLIGFGMVFTLLAPVIGATPAKYLAFLAENQTLIVVWYIVIYLIAGVFMVPLVLAFYQRLKDKAFALAQIATVFGLIWACLIVASGMLHVTDAGIVAKLYREDPAQATTVWIALSAIETGLGGTPELPGGLWALIVSWAALRVGAFLKALNYLGVLIGVAGVATVVPLFQEAATVFGLGFIVWFIWAGLILLRKTPEAVSSSPALEASA